EWRHDRSNTPQQGGKEARPRTDSCKNGHWKSRVKLRPDMPPCHDQKEKCAKEADKSTERRSRKEVPTDECRRNAAYRKPRHHFPPQLAAIEPNPAAVADQLHYRQDGHRRAHAEHAYQHGQQYCRSAETRHGRQSSGEQRCHQQNEPFESMRHGAFAISWVSARPTQHLLHGYHLHSHVAHLFEKPVEHRAVQQNVKTRPRRLPEDHVRDILLLRETHQRVGYVSIGQRDHLCAQVPRHALIFLNPFVGFTIAEFLVVGLADVHGIPVIRKPPRDARAHAQQPLGARSLAQAHHHLFRYGSLFQALSAAIFGGPFAHLLGGHAQGQFAQHVQIALAEKIRQRLLDFVRRIYLSLAEPGTQLVDGEVDVHHLVGPFEKIVGHRLANHRVRRAIHRIFQRLQ